MAVASCWIVLRTVQPFLDGLGIPMARLVYGWLTGFVASLPLSIGYALARAFTDLHLRLFPRAAMRHWPTLPSCFREHPAATACAWSAA